MKAVKHLGGLSLLPPAPDVCQECATKHEPAMLHNQQSLFYQSKFFGEHGRWPTWHDAMAHCAPALQQRLVKELAALGVPL